MSSLTLGTELDAPAETSLGKMKKITNARHNMVFLNISSPSLHDLNHFCCDVCIPISLAMSDISTPADHS
jgi:hypothetical protein